MFTVHVFFHIKNSEIAAFKKATEDNVLNSRKETGILGFDFLQQQEDKSRFLLMETYESLEDQMKHRETAHFKKWRETINDMLAEPYTFIKYDKCL
jgi:quinol monooxygenase YgiN